MTDIEQIKREVHDHFMNYNITPESWSPGLIIIGELIDYLHSRGYLGGVPAGYVLVHIDDHYKRIIHDHTKGETK